MVCGFSMPAAACVMIGWHSPAPRYHGGGGGGGLGDGGGKLVRPWSLSVLGGGSGGGGGDGGA